MDGRVLELPFRATAVTTRAQLTLDAAAVGGMIQLRLLNLKPGFCGPSADTALVTVLPDLTATAGLVQGWLGW